MANTGALPCPLWLLLTAVSLSSKVCLRRDVRLALKYGCKVVAAEVMGLLISEVE